MIPLYYATYLICQLTGIYSQQKYGRSSKNFSDTFVYSFFTGVVAMAFFFVLAGCKIDLNTRTCIYAAVFAFVVMWIAVSRLTAYRYMGIAETGVLISSLSLVFTAVSGFVLFREEITFVSALRVILMLAAVIVIFIDARDISTFKFFVGRKSFVGFAFCIFGALMWAASTVISKLFASDSAVTDSNSYFFLTNVFLCVLALFILMLFNKGRIKGVSVGFSGVNARRYSMIIVSTISSNIGSILGILILANGGQGGNVSLYAPLTSAINIIAAGIVGLVCEKEKPNIPAMFLAIVAIFLGIYN